MKTPRKLAALATLLAVILAIPVFQGGCSAKPGPTQAPSAVAPAATATPSEEPVELTILGPYVSNAQNGIQTDDVAKEIERATGVRMNLITGTDTATKLVAMIASDDMPDIALFANNDTMRSAVSAKVLLPLDDYLDKYGQNLLNNVPIMIDYARDYESLDKDGKSDGKIYILGGLPVGVFGYNPAKCFSLPVIRWDLYKKAGYPKLDTLDDHIEAMKKMVAEQPTTPDGKKVYGTGMWIGDGPWNGDYIVWGTITSMYGLTINTYCNVTNMPENDYQFFLTDPSSKFFTAARFWNKLNREGLLDPDSFTMKVDDYNQKVAEGRYVYGFAGWLFDTYNQASMAANSPDSYYVQIPPPKDDNAVWVSVNQPTGTPTNGYGISKKCKYPEKAVGFLDYLASYAGCETIFSGVQGKTWDIVDGKPEVFDETLDQKTNDPDFNAKTGVAKYQGMTFLTNNTKDPKYDTFLDFFLTTKVVQKSLTPGDKEECEYFDVDLPADLITRQTKNIIAYAPENLLIPPLPKDLQTISDNCDKYVFDNFIKMILAKTDAEYEAAQADFIAGERALGYDTVVQWWQAEREKAKIEFNKK